MRIKHANKNRPRTNARVTREAAWSMGPAFARGWRQLRGVGGEASNHVSQPSEQPWAALFITQQHSLLRPGACLPPSVPPPKQIHCISEQTAQWTEMLPASLPFPLRKRWVGPSQLLQPCSSSANTQKCNTQSQRKLACFFTLHFHLISLFNATYRKKNNNFDKRWRVPVWISKQERFRALQKSHRGL